MKAENNNMSREEAGAKIHSTMAQNCKEIQRENWIVWDLTQEKFIAHTEEIRKISEDGSIAGSYSNNANVIDPMREKLGESGKYKKDADILETYVLKQVKNSFNIVIKNAKTSENIHELDAVAVTNSGRLVIISSCLDIDETTIKEHIFEAGMHAVRYGGLTGLAIAVFPNFEIPASWKNNNNKSMMLNVNILDKNAFIKDGNHSLDNFDSALCELFEKFETLPDNYCFFYEQIEDLPKTDVELDPILQRSHRGFEVILKELNTATEFQFQQEVVKLDECLFAWIGVRSEEFLNEWILIARIDVPAYDMSIATKYRRTLYQYILTAMKYCQNNFKMLVFHNYDGSLQDETKTLGRLFKLRVLTMNPKEFRAYSNSKKIGVSKLLQEWVTGELVDDEELIKAIRNKNLELYEKKPKKGGKK